MRGGGRTCTPARFGSAGGLYGGDGIRVTVRRARARSISRAAVWRAGMDGAIALRAISISVASRSRAAGDGSAAARLRCTSSKISKPLNGFMPGRIGQPFPICNASRQTRPKNGRSDTLGRVGVGV